MAAPISKICNPELYRLEDAIQEARLGAQSSPRYELDLVRFLQTQCHANLVNLPAVLRGLEVLGEIVDEARLAALLRPFLRSSDPQIASKCVLILGRNSRSFTWLNSVMGESDDRMRANLIESLWRRTEPEAERVVKNAVKDSNHRVVANAVYGLYLLGAEAQEAYMEGVGRMIGSHDPLFRRAAIWVLKTSAEAGAVTKLKPLIRDADPSVRRAAFDALVSLRQQGAKEANGSQAQEEAGAVQFAG